MYFYSGTYSEDFCHLQELGLCDKFTHNIYRHNIDNSVLFRDAEY